MPDAHRTRAFTHTRSQAGMRVQLYSDTLADITKAGQRYKDEWNVPQLRVHYTASRGYHITMPAHVDVRGVHPPNPFVRCALPSTPTPLLTPRSHNLVGAAIASRRGTARAAQSGAGMHDGGAGISQRPSQGTCSIVPAGVCAAAHSQPTHS